MLLTVKNLSEKSPFDEVVTFITESQNKLRWYKNNRYPQVIPTIYSYIAFHSLYNYGMNPILKELFHLLVEIQNSSFLEALECETLYDAKKNSFAKKSIISRLKSVSEKAQEKYKAFAIYPDELNFSSLNDFSNAYYNMIKNLNFEEI